MTQESPNLNGYKDTNSQVFNIKDSLLKLVHYWWLFGLLIAVALTGAWLYLRYTTPTYIVSSSLLIRNEKSNMGGPGSGENIFSDIALFKSTTDKENEIEILRSRTLMERVVRSLGLSVSYYVTGAVKSTNIYKDSPFEMQIIKLRDSSQSFNLLLHFHSDTSFTLGDSAKKYVFGELITLPFGTVRMIPKNVMYPKLQFPDFQVKYNPVSDAAVDYGSSLEIKPTNQSSNVLQINYITENTALGADIVNELMVAYNVAAVEDKNEINRRIISFINDRLGLVEHQLDSVERELQIFKSDRNIIDLAAQSQLYFGNMSELGKSMRDQEIQLQVVNLVDDYMRNPANRNALVPSTLGLTDPTLLGFVSAYNELVVERTRQLQTGATSSNPVIQALDTNIEMARQKMLQNLGNIRRAFTASIRTMSGENGAIKQQITSMPEKERVSREKARQQEIKQTLYLYLLQKKEESSIAEASTTSSSRVIDKALPMEVLVSPKPLRVYGIALIIGLLLPLISIYIIDLLNDKVTTRSDITKVTAAPIVGEIGHSEQDSILVFPSHSRTVIAEQFRIVRSNINFLLADSSAKATYMVTSSFSGEGKSFVSTNLGAALALSGKKTVILEFDLRKPKILVGMGLAKGQGLTNYLVGGAELNELAQRVPDVENLYVIGSGPVPPNPSEILLTHRVDDLFNWLKKNFDAIVIDTAPIGLVSDGNSLGRFADTTLYIIRQRYTYKRQLQFVNELYQHNKVPRLGLIVNDVVSKGAKSYYGYGGGRYGYGYGYGHGSKSGYYQESKGKKKWFR